jgi:hypothetical protein
MQRKPMRLVEVSTAWEHRNHEGGFRERLPNAPSPTFSPYFRLFRTEPNPEKVLLLSDEHIK